MINILANTLQLVEEDTWSKVFMAELASVLFYVFAAVSAVAVIYAIYLAFGLAKAKDEAMRAKAKNRIHHAVAGLLIIVILTTGLFAVGFTEAIFKNVRDTNLYRLTDYDFALRDVLVGGNGKTVTLIQSGKELTADVEFKPYDNQVTEDNKVYISSGGKVTAQTEGTVRFEVYYKGKLKLEDQTITIWENDPNVNGGNPVGPGTPGGGEITKPLNKEALFQNPVDYTGVGDDWDKYYGTNKLPYVKTEFGTPIPINDITSGESSKGLAPEGFNPPVIYDRYTGVVFHNMGATVNSRNIYATRIGKVVEVGRDTHVNSGGMEHGWGNYIVIEHEINDIYGTNMLNWAADAIKGQVTIKYPAKKIIYSRYCNLAYNSIDVKVGDIVGGAEGERYTNGEVTSKPYGVPIAKMGNTGFKVSDTSQLYFEVWMPVEAGHWYNIIKQKYNVYINPFDSTQTFFVGQKEIDNARKLGQKKRQLWVRLSTAYQEFNGGQELINKLTSSIEAVNEKGWKGLFSENVQKDLENIEQGIGYASLLKTEVQSILAKDVKEELQGLVNTQLENALGNKTVATLKAVENGDFSGLLNDDFAVYVNIFLNKQVKDVISARAQTEMRDAVRDYGPGFNVQNPNEVEQALNGFLNGTMKQAFDGELFGYTLILYGFSQSDIFKQGVPETSQKIYDLSLNLDFEKIIKVKNAPWELTYEETENADNVEIVFEDAADDYILGKFDCLFDKKIITHFPKERLAGIVNGDFSGIITPEFKEKASKFLKEDLKGLFGKDGEIASWMDSLSDMNFGQMTSDGYKQVMSELKNVKLEDFLKGDFAGPLKDVFNAETRRKVTTKLQNLVKEGVGGLKDTISKIKDYKVADLFKKENFEGLLNTDVGAIFKDGDVKSALGPEAQAVWDFVDKGIAEGFDIDLESVDWDSIAKGFESYTFGGWEDWIKKSPETKDKKNFNDIGAAIEKAYKEALKGMELKVKQVMAEIENDAEEGLGAMMDSLSASMDNVFLKATEEATSGLEDIVNLLGPRMKDITDKTTAVVDEYVSMDDIMIQVIIDIIQEYKSIRPSFSTIIELEYNDETDDSTVTDINIVSLTGSDKFVTDADGNLVLVAESPNFKRIDQLDEVELHGVINVLLDELRSDIMDDIYEELLLENPNYDYVDHEAFYQAHEVEIEEKLNKYLESLEYKIAGEDGYINATETLPIKRIAEVNTIGELREIVVEMLCDLEGGEATMIIDGNTTVKVKNQWLKKALKWIVGVIATIAAIAISIISFGSLSAVLYLTVWYWTAISVAAAGAEVLLMTSEDKIVLNKKNGVPIKDLMDKELVPAGEWDGMNWVPELDENGEQVFNEVDVHAELRNKVLAYYIKKIGEERADEVMNTTIEKMLDPVLSLMNTDVEALMEREMDDLQRDIGEIVGHLGQKIRTCIDVEMEKIMTEIENLVLGITRKLEKGIEDIQAMIVQSVEGLVEDVTEILVEIVTDKVMDIIFEQLGDTAGAVVSLIFPPSPVSWYPYVETGMQINVITAVKAYFGLAKWTDVVYSVVRNTPYMNMFEQGPAVPDGFAA